MTIALSNIATQTSSTTFNIPTSTGSTGNYLYTTYPSTTTGGGTMWGTGNGYTIANPATPVAIDHAGVVELTGKNADIKINGASLKEAINRIEQRLAILTPNTKLEAEWRELKDLGDAYRKLESEIMEKMKTWDILKEE